MRKPLRRYCGPPQQTSAATSADLPQPARGRASGSVARVGGRKRFVSKINARESSRGGLQHLRSDLRSNLRRLLQRAPWAQRRRAGAFCVVTIKTETFVSNINTPRG